MIRVLTRGAAAALLFAAALSGAPARAQEADPPASTPAVVLLAPEAVRAEWTAALQIELAPTGDRVIPAEPSDAPTVLLRDAAAQQLAIESGARAAARVEGLTLRVIQADAAQARATPFAPEADARTIALILVSLLDERDALGPVPPPPAPTVVPGPVDPASTVAPPADEERAPSAADAAETAASPWPQFSFRIGTGGFGLVNDRRFIGGAMLRAGLGLRARYFEGAILLDAGLMLDSLSNAGSELQPIGRGCLEAGTAIPAGDSIAFHVGGRGCGGFAELRIIESAPFVPGGGGGFVSTFDQMGWLFSGGGYLGASFALSDWSRLYVRADVEAATLESSMHAGEVFAVLSTIFSFY